MEEVKNGFSEVNLDVLNKIAKKFIENFESYEEDSVKLCVNKEEYVELGKEEVVFMLEGFIDILSSNLTKYSKTVNNLKNCLNQITT